MSSIGWIDFSSEHRDKVRTVLDLLKKRGVIDELGIGVIRDVFADQMFPGISTIQTRAKYFTLTAYLIQGFIERRGNKETLESYLKYHERENRIHLVERHGEEHELGIVGGTFGSDRKRGVIRKPSSIYWNGLRTFGFVTPDISLSEFSARLTKGKSSLKQILKGAKNDDGEASETWEGQHPRVTIPSPDPEYWENLEIGLTPEEARLLRQHITDQQPGSLIGQMLLHEEWLEEALQLPDKVPFPEFTALPFLQHMQAPHLAATVEHARDFWHIFYGAHIRYNCLLQDGADDPALGEEFREKWEQWREEMKTFPPSWDSNFMWELVGSRAKRIGPTRRFIDSWIEETRKGCPDLTRCNELVRLQERQNKGGRARLGAENRGGHPSAWIGLQELNYRLPIVLRLLRDIHEGETKGGRHA
ncbi:MAG: DUF6361 family protein [Roseibacillus sp.]|nr:DUF6361 family protein [Roseibacillus sp.]